MKTLAYSHSQEFSFTDFGLFIFSSCNKEEKINPEQIKEEHIKVLKITDIQGSSVNVEIHDRNLDYLTESDFYFKTVYYSTEKMLELEQNTSNSSIEYTDLVDENPEEKTEILVKNYNLPEGAVGIEFNLIESPFTKGKSPSTLIFNGRSGTCGVDDIRIRGFEGSPLNCNHTHWKWSKKTSTWNIAWQMMYSATSNNSSTFIGWLDLLADYPIWNLKRDPDKSCNAQSAFTIIITSC